MPAAAVPGTQPQQQQQAAGFVLLIPPDPDWQPIDQNDTLEKDGYYMARIKGEKPRTGEGQTAGVWLTLELGDPDAVGKTLSKFMVDPRATKKDSWWSWRSLLRSIVGNTQGGQAGMQYTPGVLAGKICWIRTGAYIDDGGALRTGVDAFITQAEWQEAVTAGKHRWEAKPKAHGGGTGPTGALPGAGGGAFPGLGSGGLPGLPSSPANPMTAPSAPQPSSAAPLAQAPAAFPAQAAPAAAAPAHPGQPAFGFGAAPGFAAPAAPGGFGFTAPPPAAAPAAAAPTAPQPATNTAFPAFPGT
jgi:hypothetical protein